MAQIPSAFLAQAVPAGSAGGDLTGTYPSPTVAQATNLFTAKAGLDSTGNAGVSITGTNNTGLAFIQNLASVTAGADLLFNEAAAASEAIGISVSGDAASRYVVTADGAIHVGPGTGARDTNYGRAAAGTLYTDKNFLVGAAAALGDNGVGELQLANATTAPTTNPVNGHVIYADATSVGIKARTPAGVVVGVIDASAVATADQSTTTVTTPTTSTYLTLAVEASATYILHSLVIPNTTNAVNGLLSWTGPTGATLNWTPAANEAGYVSTLTGSDTVAGTGADKGVVYHGLLKTSTTAGTFALTFTNSAAGTTTIRANSFLALSRIA